MGLKVLRFTSREVLEETAGVMESIHRAVNQQMTETEEIPPRPLGGLKGKEPPVHRDGMVAKLIP
jgi:hypothetical protein